MSEVSVNRVAEAPIPTAHGVFQLIVFQGRHPDANPDLSDEHVALVMGDVASGEPVLVRVHSECLTSEVFGSLKCDCKEQLELAQAAVASRGRGVIVYLRQEGRGIGLANKIRAYALQAQGADTVEANEQLHLPVDAREYDVAATILRELGVTQVDLLTNNPLKVDGLRDLGIDVARRTPLLVEANLYSQPYLQTKKLRLKHEIPSAPRAADPPASTERTEVPSKSA